MNDTTRATGAGNPSLSWNASGNACIKRNTVYYLRRSRYDLALERMKVPSLRETIYIYKFDCKKKTTTTTNDIQLVFIFLQQEIQCFHIRAYSPNVTRSNVPLERGISGWTKLNAKKRDRRV